MIPVGVEVFIGIESIDLRWGFERLAGIVTERVGRSARSGALFVFRGRRGDAIKVLFFDGTGMCLFYKRLDAGRFRWPEVAEPGATSIKVDERTLEALLDGIEIQQGAGRPKKARTH